MTDWDNYRFVLAMHRAGTLRGAAEYLNVNHSTVSRRLAALNRHHGKEVFEKVPGGYQATTLGYQLVAAAEDIEAITIDAERRQLASQTEYAGPINLSVGLPIVQYLLMDAIAEFAQLYPQIQLNIDTSSSMRDLDRSEADIVIRSSPNPPEHLVGRRLFPYMLCYYANRDYLANTSEEDLCWLGKLTDAENHEIVSNSSFPDVPIGIRTEDNQMRHNAIEAGWGLGRSACFMADHVPSLMRLPGAKPFPHMDLWILTHPDYRDTPRIKACMQFFADAMHAQRDRIQGKLQ